MWGTYTGVATICLGGYAGLSLPCHLPWFHFGPLFLSHSHMSLGLIPDPMANRGCHHEALVKVYILPVAQRDQLLYSLVWLFRLLSCE